MEFSEFRKTERGGKEIRKENAKFEFSRTNTFLNGKDSATQIDLLDGSEYVGFVTINDRLNNGELDKDYVQLRMIKIEPDYRGGNASILLYEKSIEYAESLSKKLLFDSSLTVGAYNSFKKLENLGYSVIENPDAVFDKNLKAYLAPESWVLRVERNKKNV